ncbi:MAG: flagellar hook-basal body complex protein FliE [Defluviitaleaceae bacterium]|nr:flagellar hook-basal body complex protein FliE [Defluviitaleaceae bacterium]
MNINQIAGFGNVSNLAANNIQIPADNGDGFALIFDSMLNLFNETSSAENELANLQLQFVTGETDDILAVMLAEQKVQTLVTFTAQVTSSIMDAYRTIINMPV